MKKELISLGIILSVMGASAQQNLQSLLNRTQQFPMANTLPEAAPANRYSPHISQLFQLEEKYKSFRPNIQVHRNAKQAESYPDTIIVGAPPYDSLTITGNFSHTGPIYVALNGVLIIKNANFTNIGDLDAFDNGKIIVDSSTLSFPQNYFYQRSLIAINKANISISNTTLSYGGMSHNCLVIDTASLTLTHVNQTDWTTTGMSNSGTITINGTTQAGEFIITDYVTLNIKNATNTILWHQFPDTAVINWSFGMHDTTYAYQFNNSQPGVHGIEYHINADSDYDIMWSMMPSSGSVINITNSKIRSIGLWFDRPADSTVVSGITDNATYASYTTPLPDRTLTFTNCTVETWNFYVFHKSIINVTGCIAGEIGSENSSKMYGTNYMVDGSGGYHWSSDTSVSFADQSTVYSYVRSEKNSIFVFAYGAVVGSGAAEAIDNSLLIVVQSLVPADPTAVNGAAAEFDNINQPGNAFADSVVPVNGSAWIHRGPTSNWMYFKNWQLFYKSTDSNNWIPITGTDTLPASNSLLANWNTHLLTDGDYLLDLRITDTWGNQVDAIRAVTLLPLSLGVNTLASTLSMHIYPNPAKDELNINITSAKNENITVEIDNMLGQNISNTHYAVASGENIINLNTSGLSAGTYVCRVISAEGASQKLVEISK